MLELSKGTFSVASHSYDHKCCPSHMSEWFSDMQYKLLLFSSVVLTSLSLLVQTAEVVLRASV